MSKPIVYAADVTILADPKWYKLAYNRVSPQRRQRVDRIRFDRDKRLSLGVELLLQYALQEAGLPVSPLHVTLGEYGKPELPGVHFNLSHSGQWAVCAVADTDVGCDVEQMQSGRVRVARQFAPEEYEDIQSIEEENAQMERFYRYWTLKESFMKATGRGLTLPMDQFCIELGDKIAVIQAVEQRTFSFAEFSDLPGYRCAVCLADEGRDVAFRVIDLREIWKA